ncbi:MAG: GntR family transcriptional regulator [Alphaproteobacteria bacterium]|nr:GntR family transcriptional regulator [Alphaproteobacteria bacterium]
MPDDSSLPVTLPAKAVDALRQMILDGELPPGARLSERALGERLGVSRTPLREALRMLASEGLVRHEPNRGAVVAPLDRADIEATFELLAALEGLAGELAARRIDAAQLAEIKALHFEMRAHHARGDRAAYFRANQEIHRHIAAAAANPVLVETFERLNARVKRVRYAANLTPERWAKAVEEHERMIAALDARDGAALRAILEAHLAGKRQSVLAAFAGTAEAYD